MAGDEPRCVWCGGVGSREVVRGQWLCSACLIALAAQAAERDAVPDEADEP